MRLASVMRWPSFGQVKKAFDEAGITIPFPQRDVHVYNSKVD